MWDPRYQAIPFNMAWTILARVRDYNMTTWMHKLCLMERKKLYHVPALAK